MEQHSNNSIWPIDNYDIFFFLVTQQMRRQFKLTRNMLKIKHTMFTWNESVGVRTFWRKCQQKLLRLPRRQKRSIDSAQHIHSRAVDFIHRYDVRIQYNSQWVFNYSFEFCTNTRSCAFKNVINCARPHEIMQG